MERFLALPRFAFNPAYVEHAPDDTGVYGLFEHDELIYVGTAKRGGKLSIRDCLRRHLRGECTRDATHYAWELTLWPNARETQILAGFTQQTGRDPRCQQLAA